MSVAFEALKERAAKSICNSYGRYPIAVSRAENARIYDLDGKEYVDLLAGIAVTNLGHCRPELAEVMAAQARKLVHVSNLFFQEEQVALAEKLLATCHAGKVFFCNSGAEANEAAVKLARRYAQRIQNRDAYEVVTLLGSFHGRTLSMVAATGQDKIKDGFAPLPEGFKSVPWGDLGAIEAAITDKTAAVLVEIVQGEGGVRPMPREYAQGIQALCRAKNALFMVDEIQTGLCRTGRFWAFQHYGLEPDIFTSSKGLANGLPMGAMLATDKVAAGFVPGSHATTFGGGGVLSAVAAKVVDILVQDKLAERAQELGEYAVGLFNALKAKYPGAIADVRGLGLLLGVELGFPGQEVWSKLIERGFILNLTQERVLRLVPPLTIERADFDAFAAALGEILAAR
jgi:acetylornithine aminotransferase